MKKREILMLSALVLVTGGILFGVQRLLMPKYMGRVVEGNFTEEYYKETTEHDVLFLGDCEVYENISPIVLFREFGITSYFFLIGIELFRD